MTKHRENTVLPQMVHPSINGEVLYPFGPPVYRCELDEKIVDMLIEEGQRTRDNKKLDHRDQLAGNMKQGTSILYPFNNGNNKIRNQADQAIVQKVFEFFEILQSNYGEGWPNISNMMMGQSGGMGALRLQQLWINFQQAGDYNPLHDHTGLFSFVIFGDIDEDIFTEGVPVTNANSAGQIVFHYGEKISQLQMNSFGLKPYKGLMLVFPAALEHMVGSYWKDFERISISGNYVLEQNVQKQNVNPVKLDLQEDNIPNMIMKDPTE